MLAGRTQALPVPQTAARESGPLKMLRETRGSIDGELLTGAAQTAWLERRAAAPAANTHLRDATTITGLPFERGDSDGRKLAHWSESAALNSIMVGSQRRLS
jgi:hypothetical protein